jgi:hypothetical protein
VIRGARFGLPLMLAVIGGAPSRFAPYVELYKRALEELGFPPLPVGMHSPGYVSRTDQEAIDIQWPHWAEALEAASRERGWARPTMDTFRTEIAVGSLYADRQKPSRPSWRRQSGYLGSVDSTWPMPPDEYLTNESWRRSSSMGVR